MNNAGERLRKHPAYTKTNYLEVFVHQTKPGQGSQCVLGEAVGLGRAPTPSLHHTAANRNNLVKLLGRLYHSCYDYPLTLQENFQVRRQT